MPFTAGARIGPYEIDSLLGAGGMGEVYRARDSRLKRQVALKVLPDRFADDPDRLARFQREAELLATITHANIAGVYGLEETADGAAIVMELVEGETLADRIRRGPIPLDEALAIARQLAEGLEAAHEKGVVHRDLKPANLKITADGHVKILDFGLAKLLEQTPSAASLAMSPTLSLPATVAGVILGTASYMSPEQARGRTVDRRTDVWAFGCVLFEMLTGKRAFESDDTVSDVVAAILKNEPNWAALPADTPDYIRTLLRRCLQKDRQKRLPHIGLVRVEIDEAPAPEGGKTPGRPAAMWVRVAPWAIAFAAVGWGIWATWRTPPVPIAAPLRVTADLGADASLAMGPSPSAVLSPDGATLVFSAQKSESDPPLLYARRLDQLHATPLSGTENATGPFFSPDARWVGYFADGKLKKIAVTGGAAITICDAVMGRGGSWTADDRIVFSPDNVEGTPLMQVSSGGGVPQRLTTIQPGDFSHRWPQVIAGGTAVLYTVNRSGFSFDSAALVVQPLPAGTAKVVRRNAYFGRLLPTGHLLFVQDGVVSAATFDTSRLELTGEPMPVVQGAMSNAGSGGVQLSVAENGTLMYVPGPSLGGAAAIAWLDRSGQTSTLRATRAEWSDPRFSHDGSRLAFDSLDGQQTDIWVYEWGKDLLSRLTFDPNDDLMPLWSPDDERITFASKRGDKIAFNLYWERADGSGALQRLTDSPHAQIPTSWHPSGRYLAFHQRNPQTGLDVMLLPMEGSEAAGWKPGQPTMFASGPADEVFAAFSPDGRWIAYESDETGRLEVYVRPFPRADRRWLVSAGGRDAGWSRSANELLYIGADGRLMAVPYSVEGGTFRTARPQAWSQIPIPGRSRFRSYDVHPDGSRLALPAGIGPQGAASHKNVVLVFNFFEELRRLASGPAR